MKKTKRLLLAVFVLSVPALIYVASAVSACCGDEQFRNTRICTWSRGDNSCNSDSECCPGFQCGAFLRCERCR